MYHRFVLENSCTPPMKVFVFNLLTQGLVPLNLVIFETLSFWIPIILLWVGIDIFWKLSHLAYCPQFYYFLLDILVSELFEELAKMQAFVYWFVTAISKYFDTFLILFILINSQ